MTVINRRRIFSTFIAVALAAASLLANSCAKSADIANTTTEASTALAAPAVQTTAAEIQPNVPVVDYGGYNFRIECRTSDWCTNWGPRDLVAAEETGEPVNDAVYARNTYIEDTYNIKITDLPSADQYTSCSKSIKAGSDDFDIIEACIGFKAGSCGYQCSLAQQGMLLDLKTMPNLELTQIWYDQNANAQMSIAGKLFYSVSDLTVADKDAVWLVLFDKKLLQNYGLDDPYQLVQSNQWTMDKMLSMSKGVAKDLNGDGKMDETDQYGLVTEMEDTTNMFNGGGQLIAAKDSSDLPQITMFDDPLAAQVVDLAYQIQTDPSTFLAESPKWSKVSDMWSPTGAQVSIFSQERGLFYFTSLIRVTDLRSSDADFGILPVPMYNTAQGKYYNPVHTEFSEAASVPVTASDVNRTTVILEALTAKSHYTLLPAYYDVCLKTKYSRDTQSSAMLDLIFATRVYDVGRIFDWGGLATALWNLANDKSDDIASKYASLQSKAQDAMAKTVTAFQQAGSVS